MTHSKVSRTAFRPAVRVWLQLWPPLVAQRVTESPAPWNLEPRTLFHRTVKTKQDSNPRTPRELKIEASGLKTLYRKALNPELVRIRATRTECQSQQPAPE